MWLHTLEFVVVTVTQHDWGEGGVGWVGGEGVGGIAVGETGCSADNEIRS